MQRTLPVNHTFCKNLTFAFALTPVLMTNYGIWTLMQFFLIHPLTLPIWKLHLMQLNSFCLFEFKNFVYWIQIRSYFSNISCQFFPHTYVPDNISTSESNYVLVMSWNLGWECALSLKIDALAHISSSNLNPLWHNELSRHAFREFQIRERWSCIQ